MTQTNAEQILLRWKEDHKEFMETKDPQFIYMYKRNSSDYIGSYEYRNVFDAELLRDFEEYAAKYYADPQGRTQWEEQMLSLAEEMHDRGLVYKRIDQWNDADNENYITEPRNTKFVQDMLKLLRRGQRVGNMKHYSEKELSRIHDTVEKRYEEVFRHFRGKDLPLSRDIQWYDACWRDWNYLLTMNFDTDNDCDMLYFKQCKWGQDFVSSIESIEERLSETDMPGLQEEAFAPAIQISRVDPENWYDIDPAGSGYSCNAIYIGNLFNGDMSVKLDREYIPQELFYEYLQEYFDILNR